MESMGGVTKMWRPFRPERDIGRADSTCTHGQLPTSQDRLGPSLFPTLKQFLRCFLKIERQNLFCRNTVHHETSYIGAQVGRLEWINSLYEYSSVIDRQGCPFGISVAHVSSGQSLNESLISVSRIRRFT